VRHNPLTHSTYLIQKAVNSERNLRSQLCDSKSGYLELRHHKGHK